MSKSVINWHKPDAEKPQIGTAVQIMYLTANGEKGTYTGMWVGDKWLVRRPYSRMDFDPFPEDMTLLAWGEWK